MCVCVYSISSEASLSEHPDRSSAHSSAGRRRRRFLVDRCSRASVRPSVRYFALSSFSSLSLFNPVSNPNQEGCVTSSIRNDSYTMPSTAVAAAAATATAADSSSSLAAAAPYLLASSFYEKKKKREWHSQETQWSGGGYCCPFSSCRRINQYNESIIGG